MFNLFIKRPVLSLVISLFFVLLGLLSFFTLPVELFPDIAPPSVAVRTKYRGANAEVAAKTVATPLEKVINGVPGMTYMTSVSSNRGTVIIKVYFEAGTDPDLAAVEIQNRISTVVNELPEEAIKAGVTVEKQVEGLLMYINVASEDPSLDEAFIYNFTDLNVLQELRRVDGVGLAEIMSTKDYSMRIWLKPDRMTAYEVSTDDVVAAIRNQNVEAAPGQLGISSGKDMQMLQYVLKYTGKFFEPRQYENLVIRANADGSILRLKDIADVEFGNLNYGRIAKMDGRPAASVMVIQRPGSNASEVIANVKKKMESIREGTFPSGMDYKISYDVSRFLNASIQEVLVTLVEAFILVFIVVFIFLQDFRSTLIPTLAVPVALIGTLFFMQWLGFSINLLTLFALVLAIGIVVDNAIVVVEAVHAKMEKEGLAPRAATFAAMKEISAAIIAITMVMSAVFIPVAFMSGPVGIFYRQFSLTLAFAIFISGINALTLTPALCAILLQNHYGMEKKRTLLQRFFDGFNRFYNFFENKYYQYITYIVPRRGVTTLILVFFFIATWGISKILPTGFIPTEDQSMVYVNVTTPVGATVERTEKVLDELVLRLEGSEAVESVSSLAGYSLGNGLSGASYGMAMVNLKSWDERKDLPIQETLDEFRNLSQDINDAKIDFFLPPTVSGFGNSSGFQMKVLDQTGTGNLDRLATVTNDLIAELEAAPEINNAFTDFDPTFPQFLVSIDQDMAAKNGVTIAKALSTMQVLLGGMYVSDFVRFEQMYDVMLQASPEYRAKPEDVLNLHVKNNEGEMVPISSFLTMEKAYGPEQLTRFNMYNSSTVKGAAAPGYSSGDVIAAIERITAEKLPQGYNHDWYGMSREEVGSGNQAIIIFLICLLFVYLILSAQYESFLLPLPVILSLPVGVFGAFFALYVLGLQNNIYAQVALIMLIGLLGKNAILIVEFAIQKKAAGHSVIQAAVEGAVTRLRPILMTSFAFIAGLLPLAMASGAGALGNRSIGTAAAGGMLIGTIFGLIIIPGLYVIFAHFTFKRIETAPELPVEEDAPVSFSNN
ncbi:hydrophobe/amphiphile efflux-1 (HAE1) family protein [Cyclobacterium lianum]|uniref:Hydrophobe/amphiphile efflux-1 (HAE1) family protein n=1 Tax=Cyclobacterium lianum TaxID=388280 RepID=A0A1M7I0L6_9BACT|nr:efflux RND transporter permease subunit [Cyclobacterium lianum]SHM34113.1 hydrophobe/amphiphile efflux-1 (HAE1) family protein [Cyclobacterium lianum]